MTQKFPSYDALKRYRPKLRTIPEDAVLKRVVRGRKLSKGEKAEMKVTQGKSVVKSVRRKPVNDYKPPESLEWEF